jgi:hypothetical protein
VNVTASTSTIDEPVYEPEPEYEPEYVNDPEHARACTSSFA